MKDLRYVELSNGKKEPSKKLMKNNFLFLHEAFKICGSI